MKGRFRDGRSRLSDLLSPLAENTYGRGQIERAAERLKCAVPQGRYPPASRASPLLQVVVRLTIDFTDEAL